MYCKDDYVNYGTHGICQIEDIQCLTFDSGQKERQYYILKPVEQKDSSIFVPVDNQKLTERMRQVLTQKEIDSIILSARDEDMVWVNDRKERSARFQSILRRRDEKEMLMLVSCLYLKSQEGPKGITQTDAEILNKARKIIEQEFSFSLHMNPGDVGDYIREKMKTVAVV